MDEVQQRLNNNNNNIHKKMLQMFTWILINLLEDLENFIDTVEAVIFARNIYF